MDVKFVADEIIPVNYSPLRTGLRPRAKQFDSCVTPVSTGDDRRLRYSQEVLLESSTDEENDIIRPAGEAVLSQTPISSHDVFSFKKIKKKTALAAAASEAVHVKTPQAHSRQKIPTSEPTTMCKNKKRTQKMPLRNKNSTKTKSRKMVKHQGSSEDISSDSDQSNEIDEKQNGSERIARIMNMADDENDNLEEMLDEYFLAHDEKNCLTSDRTLSHLSTPRMDQETLTAVLKSKSLLLGGHSEERRKLYLENRSYFDKWAFQLRNGFNLLFHGLGSKRSIIDQFRSAKLSKSIQLVVNGFFPSITVKNILNSITNDIIDHEGSFKNPIEHCNFIKNYYEENEQERLYLIIHNIDGTMLRSSTTQTILSLLAQSPSILLIASIDHIHAPLIWDQTQCGRFNWLWYDVTTFEPYIEETSYENSLLVQQSGSLALSSLIHVFRSLTANAKGVFMLIANYQLEYSLEGNYVGLSFHDCYTKSREAFLVNSDATLRAQLTEFRDHKLIRSKKGNDGVEYLLIPLDESTLKQFIEDQENN